MFQPNAATSAPPLPLATRLKLSLMMFLQYAIWGSWLPVFFKFLTEHRYFTGEQAGYLFGVAAIGALVAPFLAGQIADRFFNTEKFLGISHILGAILVWNLATVESYWWLLPFGVVYSLIYVPTLSLTNALAFHHLPDRDRDFGRVRVWGTVGWIAAGIGVGQFLFHQHTPSDAALIPQVLAAAAYTADEAAALQADHAALAKEDSPEHQRFDEFRTRLDAAAKAAATTAADSKEKSTDKENKPSEAADVLASQAVRDVKHAEKVQAVRLAEQALTDKIVADGDLPAQGSTDKQTSFSADEAQRWMRLKHFEEAINAARSHAQAEGMAAAFKLSSVLGLILGMFCFSLPATPPQKGESRFAAGEAVREIVKNPLATLFLVAFPIACIHQFYFVRTAGFLDGLKLRSPWIDWIFGVGGGPMTIGQFSELCVLALMPFLAQRLSRKTLLAIGLLAYVARFGIFAYLPYPWAVYPALALHGLCFGCFFFVAFMVIDENSTSDVRASAQSLFGFIIFGLGVIAGNIAAGKIDTLAKHGESTDYKVLFGVPMIVALFCLMLHLLLYPAGRRKPTVR